eukprot:TRINITY_DN4186_c0_g1_i2.p2 TRINITY_DN4186_c0_g1~~TRINITY_DN4186_c0_g1_i2.p2  ORF type:complete len:113 (+),score=12.98 TRINITY_DN4186_c0_g1_i2:436-774(+)
MDLDDFFADLDRSVAKCRMTIQGAPEQDWDAITQQALDRGISDCAICLGNVETCRHTGARQVTVLSCSHMFHSACISSFERFSTSEDPVCPICRSSYEKKELGEVFADDADL